MKNNRLTKLLRRADRIEAVHHDMGVSSMLWSWGFLVKDNPSQCYDYISRTLPDYVGIYLLQGRGCHVDWMGKRHDLEAGCFLQLPPGKPHSVYHDPNVRWVEFFFPLPARLYNTWLEVGGIGTPEPVLRPGLHAHLIEQCEQLLKTVKHSTWDPLLYAQGTSLSLRLMVSMWQTSVERHSPDRRYQLMLEARRILGRDLAQKCDLLKLSENLGMGYEQFRKLFKHYMGIAPGEYRIRRRLDQAKTLLQRQQSVAQTARALGYPDAFCFSRQFKRYTGISPSRFRQTLYTHWPQSASQE